MREPIDFNRIIRRNLLSGLLRPVLKGDDDEPLRTWRVAAQSCGLQIVETSRGLKQQIKAQAGAVEVWIETYGDMRQSRIVVSAPAPPDFQSLMILPESLHVLGREVEIGDRRFDDEFFIGGPTRLVLALLDAETRRLVLDAKARSRLEISSGALQAIVSDYRKVPELLPLLLDLGKRFDPAIDLWRRLAENSRQDPEPGVRLQNLLVLIREFPGYADTVEALRKACSDPSPEIRLRAAKKLGAEAHSVLLDLAEKLEDDAMSAEALSILDRELPFERARAILDRAVSGRYLRTAKACLEALGRSGAAAVELLINVMEREHGELAPAAARALGATGSPAAEAPLIQALEREDADLRVAAAEALGRVGSTVAVLPLKEADERSRLDRKLHRATRQAIAEIQARVQGASPGQLSLAGAEAGQLSLAQGEAGQLSLAEDPAGRLSIKDDSHG